MQVLDPIPAGIKREEFNQVLQERIETATQLLMDEARERDGRVPFPFD